MSGSPIFTRDGIVIGVVVGGDFDGPRGTGSGNWGLSIAVLREMLDKDFESEHHRKFRANRSLRDVEPEVNLFLRELSAVKMEDGT